MSLTNALKLVTHSASSAMSGSSLIFHD